MTDKSAIALRECLERAKHITLAESNAHAITETVRQHRAAPEIHRRRGDLRTNSEHADARDTKKRTNKIEVDASGDAVAFKHDGAYCDNLDLSHFFYHGPTKKADPTNRGKFGTGFITIHLVSDVVEVRGVPEYSEGASLSFRSGTAAPEIQAAMPAKGQLCQFQRTVESWRR